MERLAALAAVAAWRLGLGWLVGRRYILLTTTAPGSGLRRRTPLPFVYDGGDLYAVAGDGSYGWYRDVLGSPRVTIQAHPGPKGMVARRIVDAAGIDHARRVLTERAPRLLVGEARRLGIDPADGAAWRARSGDLHWVRLQPTGQPAPEMTPPDLVWLWVVAAAVARLLARRRRR